MRSYLSVARGELAKEGSAAVRIDDDNGQRLVHAACLTGPSWMGRMPGAQWGAVRIITDFPVEDASE